MAGRVTYYGGIVTKDLVLDLDAGKLDSYPRTGNIWKDISGNLNNSTLINGPSFNNIKGGVLLFDGINQYVQVPNSSLFQNNTNMSVSIWLNFSSYVTPNTYSFINKGRQEDKNYFWLSWYNTAPGNRRLYWEVGYDTSNFIALTYNWTPTLNTWYNIVGTFEPTIARIYVDGLLVSSGTTTATYVGANNPAFPFSIGSYRGNLAYFFPGNLNQPLFYRKTLSSSEVLQNYNATKVRYL